MVKVSRDKNKKRPSYLSSTIAMAPIAALSSSFDFPKGYIDKKIESKITRVPGGSASSRGLGRATGKFTAGLITTPLFVSGIKDLKNAKNNEDRKRGFTKVIASGAVYSATKGGVETAIEQKSIKKALGKIKDVATVRGVIGAAAAAGTAAAIAEGMKKEKNKKNPSLSDKYLIPTAGGAVVGALKGGAEAAYLGRKDLKKFVKNPRLFLGPVAGRATAGALGAVVLSEVAKKTMDKVGSVSLAIQKMEDVTHDELFDTPKSLYYKTKMWASSKGDLEVKSAYGDTIRHGAERSPSARAVYYALHDDLMSRGYKDLPPPKMREEVFPIQPKDKHQGSVGIAVAALLAPQVVSGAMEAMPANQKDKVLRDALDSIAATQGIDVYDSNDPGFWKKMNLNPSIGPHAQTTGRRYIATPKGNAPEIMAHELGHQMAGSFRKKVLQSAEAKKVFRYGQMMNLLVPVAVVATASDQSFSTKEEREAKAKVLNEAGIVGTAMMAPVLGEEAMANVKAMKLMTKAQVQTNLATKGVADVSGAVTSSAKRMAKMIPAFGTYASAAVVPFLLAKYIQKDES